jgi:hypothetical protein
MKQKLPELFTTIIDHDNSNPAFNPVLTLREYRAWRWRRRELTTAAEGFVKRQRGGK